MCPSIGPLLQGVVIDSSTASKIAAQRAGKLSNEGESVAESIQFFSFLALRHLNMAPNRRLSRRNP